MAPVLHILCEVLIYMRWTRWLLSHTTRLNEVVVVNMDETRLDNQAQWQHGYHMKRRCHLGVSPGFVRTSTRESRRTLIAALCSNEALQGRLPQVTIQKSSGSHALAAGAQPRWQRGGTEWRNSTGAVDAKTLARWVYSLRCAVDAHTPTAWIILALDCCPVHMSLKFLQHCCRLGVILVFLPARCTWFMQPLDVYVFGPLKRQLASTRAARRAAGAGATSDSTSARSADQKTEATAYLANADGPRALARCGMHLDYELWRGPLRNLVVGCDLKARPPTEDELAVLLSRTTKQAARMRPLLLSWPQRLQNASIATRPPRLGLPVRRPPAPEQGSVQASAIASAPAGSGTRAMPMPRATRFGLPYRATALEPPPETMQGPAHGTRLQAAARRHER